MPVGITRFNAQPSHHPNHLITFVRPLPGPDSSLAETYLHAVAAICLPIMKKYHLSVTTLEEHEPNREFIGRNFNNGEIIQLVLKNRGGGWMPFRHVQMVMMHELAHNVQMNHGKNFWIERNKFAADLRELWAKGYTGDGFWGRGRTVDLETIESNAMMPEGDQAPLGLCGGTFRSRRRKRKRAGDAQELTWKEKRDRRIEKKFGKNGVKLGEDDTARMMLEIGKSTGSGKPRVANSKRGRELRAAAALARFSDQQTIKSDEEEKEEDDDNEYEEDSSIKGEDARDSNGQRLLDSMGFGMVKVCEDADSDDTYVKQEMAELEGLNNRTGQPANPSRPDSKTPTSRSQTRIPSSRSIRDIPPSTSTSTDPKPTPVYKSLYDIPQYTGSPSPEPAPEPAIKSTSNRTAIPTSPNPPLPRPQATSKPGSQRQQPTTTESTCPICTLGQPSTNVTCIACAHVLDRRRDPRSWICKCSSSSTGPQDDDHEGDRITSSVYVNAGDVGVCGLCGSRRDEE